MTQETYDTTSDGLQPVLDQQTEALHEVLLQEAKRDAGVLRYWIHEALSATEEQPFRLLDVAEDPSDHWLRSHRYNLVVTLEPVFTVEGRKFIEDTYERKIADTRPGCAHRIAEDIADAYITWHRSTEKVNADAEARRFLEQQVLAGRPHIFSERTIDIRWDALQMAQDIVDEIEDH